MLSNFTRLVSAPISFSSKSLFSTSAALKWAYNIPLVEFATEKAPTLDTQLEEFKDRKITSFEEAELPYAYAGTKSFAPLSRAYDQMILNPNTVDLNKVHANINSIFNKYYQSLANPKDNFPASESNFLWKTRKALTILKNNGFKLEVRKNEADFAKKSLKESVSIIEAMHIVGLNVERALNAPLEYYQADRSEERKGLMRYVLKPSNEPENKAEEEAMVQKVRDAVRRGQVPIHPFEQFILRIYVQYVSPYQIIATHNGKEVPLKENYSFNHVAVLESQLRLPPIGSTKNLEFGEKLKHYRLQPWKLVDFDGALQGNALLLPEDKHKGLVYLE